jgi:hypothetical protein
MIKSLHGWIRYRLTAARVRVSLLLPVTSGPAELPGDLLLAAAGGRVGLLPKLHRERRVSRQWYYASWELVERD